MGHLLFEQRPVKNMAGCGVFLPLSDVTVSEPYQNPTTRPSGSSPESYLLSLRHD
jgi:hypothetical protein